ncbi:SCO family protein [Rickettsia endosymbiont of Cardiosporidium cionae]|uniref:SCO family protein n=1 Tax=Rickettsia endosymbiont of Cardiosporidium cionae TaxID=2777155 RepID=UPI00189445BC|nr:SCO family protein [Rickettsia endosymbiont of Cardiosporidium cionae]KAF8818778.1 SCO family protein [Rickettsia endosymbiont of Cardiosporidium cionae]
MSKATKTILIISLVVSVIALTILMCTELTKKPMVGEGSSIQEDEELIGGIFTLTDFNGNQFSTDHLKGKVSLVYFGFTYCPDICPTSLNKLVSVVNTLKKYNIDINTVFVTVDPARDTTSALKEYLGHYNTDFIGLTGTEDKIKEVSNMFKVYYAKVQDINSTNSSKNYMVDHSSFVYVLDKNAKYIKYFYYGSTKEDIVDFIRLNK